MSPLSPPGSGCFSDFPSVIKIFSVLKITSQIFCRMSLRWDLSDIFSWLDLGYEFWGEDHRVIFITWSHGCYCQHGLSLSILAWIAWLKSHLIDFSLWSYSSSFFQENCHLWQDVTDWGSYILLSISIDYLKFFFGKIISFSPTLFTYSFICL